MTVVYSTHTASPQQDGVDEPMLEDAVYSEGVTANDAVPGEMSCILLFRVDHGVLTRYSSHGTDVLFARGKRARPGASWPRHQDTF